VHRAIAKSRIADSLSADIILRAFGDQMPSTTPLTRPQRIKALRSAKGSSSAKKTPKKRTRATTLAAANKWMTEEHDRILKLAERNTAKLTGKPRL
jgi:hypothetical protein